MKKLKMYSTTPKIASPVCFENDPNRIQWPEHCLHCPGCTFKWCPALTFSLHQPMSWCDLNFASFCEFCYDIYNSPI